MIDDTKRRLGTRDAPARLAQSGKRLRAGVFVEYVTIDVEKNMRRIELADGVSLHDLFVERSRLGRWGVHHCASECQLGGRGRSALEDIRRQIDPLELILGMHRHLVGEMRTAFAARVDEHALT